MIRSSGLELPSAEELRTMIRKESSRKAVRRDYLEKHVVVFEVVRREANQAGIDITVLDNYRTQPFDMVIAQLHTLVDSLEQFLRQPERYSLAETFYRPLVRSSSPERSDLIFVFGSSQNLRIEKAVELYKQDVAPKIMTTGAAPHWGELIEPEGEMAARHAIELGVPEGDIIVENQSIATPDNVKRGIDILEEMNWRPAIITIVTSEFNTRRAEMDMYKFTPWDLEISIASPVPSDELDSHNWIRTERGRRIILNEYAKLIIESKIDQVLADGELS